LAVAIGKAVRYEGTAHGPLASVVLPRRNGARPLVAQVVPLVGRAHDVLHLVSSDNFLPGLFDLLGIFTGAVGTATITWNTIKNQLATTNTTITTSGSLGSGNITISANSPDLATPNALRLLAHSDIAVNGSITNTGSGALEMYAGWDGASTISPVVASSGNININQPLTLAGNAIFAAGAAYCRRYPEVSPLIDLARERVTLLGLTRRPTWSTSSRVLRMTAAARSSISRMRSR
jgi:hypothetical protein